MNYSLLKLYLENPRRARECACGLELAAVAFQAQAIKKGFLNVEKWRGLLRNARFVNPDERNFGLEVAAAAFDAQIRKLEAVSRDKHGHFYKHNGAACPHSDGSGAKETSESVKRKEQGVKAVKNILKGNVSSSEMTTRQGKRVIFENGNSAYGVEHFKARRFASGDAKTDSDFDKIIDGVVKAIANAEPYEKEAKGTKRICFDYKKYRAVCCERDDTLIFITGYKIYENGGR